MKNLQIIILLLLVNLCNAASQKFENIRDSIFTKTELINKFKVLNYKLVYQKEHSYKTVDNEFFVFTELDKNLGIEQGRILVTCKIIGRRYKILDVNDSIIYPHLYCTEVDDSFSKISSKGFYITFEEYSNSKYQKEIVHEFITFKYDIEKLKYFLNKYSIVIEHINVDKDPVQTLTKQDFGTIEMENFYFGILNSSVEKFPKDTFEKLRLPTYWIEKKNK